MLLEKVVRYPHPFCRLESCREALYPWPPVSPNKWMEPKDLFLGLSSRQHSSCLGKHVNWRRKIKVSSQLPWPFSPGPDAHMKANFCVLDNSHTRWTAGVFPGLCWTNTDQLHWAAWCVKAWSTVLFCIICEGLGSKSVLCRTRETEGYNRGSCRFPGLA